MDKRDALIDQLLAENKHLQARIAELEKRLGLNSNNSGKPPSSDGLNKPPRVNTRSLREKGKKPSGGQSGHSGTTLKQVTHPEKTLLHVLSHCPDCVMDLKSHEVKGIIRRQVFDIPEPRIEITEHQAEIKYCTGCNRKVQASFPETVNAPVQYGPKIKSYAVYFQQEQLIPEDRIQRLFLDVFNVSIATATIVSFSKEVFGKLAPFASMVFEAMKLSPRKHLDETGFRIGGKTQWLHVASNETLTYYHISPKRKSLLSGLRGIVSHDHWKPYYKLKKVKHALCNAHHIREINAVIEYENEGWAKKMKRFLYFALACKRHHDGKVPQEKKKRLFALYDRILREGMHYHESLPTYSLKPKRGRSKKRTGHNLLLRLDKYRVDVLRFLTVPDVPFSNNQAEQDIRMMKVKQKISGGFRTVEGAEIFARIRLFTSTMRKQRQNIFTSLTQVIFGHAPQFF